jgi:hypothetical protein
VPKTVRDIRVFVGLAGYYRRLVPNFAGLAKSLTNLTKKDVPFVWTQECQQAFDELKRILSTEPFLIYPDFSQPFVVVCDALTKAIGAVLSQRRNWRGTPHSLYETTVKFCQVQI